MVEDKATHWIRLSELKQYYLMTLDDSIDLMMLFGKEGFEKMNYKPKEPTLEGLIKYCKNFNVPGWKTAILDKNNNLLKITNG